MSPQPLLPAKRRRRFNYSEALTRYVFQRPSIRDCLRRNIVNHSALARLVAKQNNRPVCAALVTASYRLGKRLARTEANEGRLERIFNDSRVVVHGGMTLTLCKAPFDQSQLQAFYQQAHTDRELFLTMQGLEFVTLIATERFAVYLGKKLGKKALRTFCDLALISIRFPPASTLTYGISARLSSLLAQAGIVMLQEMTSAGEYFIVVATKDISTALDALEERRVPR